jgi:hypothetical protein
MTPQPDPAANLPRLYLPAELATALGVSEWWVKNEARHRRIPSVKIAGAWRFTSVHFAQIVAKHEQAPEVVRAETTTPRRRTVLANPDAPQLQARTPRRQRRTA